MEPKLRATFFPIVFDLIIQIKSAINTKKQQVGGISLETPITTSYIKTIQELHEEMLTHIHYTEGYVHQLQVK